MSQSVYLLCYDIADPRRLQKVYRTSCKAGMPLQYSVFCIVGNEQTLQPLLTDLADIIDENEDDIRVYRISSQQAITSLGQEFLPDKIHLITA